MRLLKNCQSILEYVVLLAIVALAVGGMRMYVLRSVKAKFKVIQDQLSDKYQDNSKIKQADTPTQ
jgi:Flp pilus assembly pilin Flp